MGQIHVNATLARHVGGATPAVTGWRLRIHHGDQSIETESADMTDTECAELIADADAATAFASTASGILGGWWSARSTGQRERLRLACQGAPSP
jgi:hypothetical protein